MFKMNKRYDFSLKSNGGSTDGLNHNSMLVIGKCNAKIALSRGYDVYTKHATMSGLIPDLPTDVNDMEYVIFNNLDGTEVIFAEDYIDAYSVVEVNTFNLRIDIFNVNTEDRITISNRLKELGYTDFKISKLDIY